MAFEARLLYPGDTINYTPGGNVAAGEVVVLGSFCLVAQHHIATGVKGALLTRGVFECAKKTNLTITAGDGVYWDDSNNYVTKTSTDTYMGIAVADAALNDTTVLVLLRGMESAAAETLSLANLTDITGPVSYTAGKLLVADSDSYESQAVSGPWKLSGTGALAMASATVAAFGDSQATATPVAQGFTLVTAADGGKGIVLPDAAAGLVCIIKNRDSENAVLKVYPNTGDAINAIAANTALSMAAKTIAYFVAYDATTWYTLPLSPS